MAPPSADLEALDRESLLHPFTAIASHLERGPHVITRAEGSRVWDQEGRSYLDAMAGLWCVNVGYGRHEIADAIAEQARRLPYFHSFLSMSNEPAIRLADRLLRMAPRSMARVFFANSGSEANETQVKLVWYYWNLRGRPEKKKIVSRTGGYHGVTLGATSMTGLPNLHALFDLPLARFLHVGKPHHYREARPGESERAFSQRLADELDATIRREGPETVAAFIAEPVMGAGGVIVPPEGYFEAIVPVLREHEVLFIADEVICGFGRLGAAFGCDVFGLEPDLMTLAKGLTSSYVPMSACLLSERVWEVLRDGSGEAGPFAHGYTTTAHPVSAAAAHANLDILLGEKLVERAARTGADLQRRLRERFEGHPLVGEVRGLGMIAGLELVADRATREPLGKDAAFGTRIFEACLEEGVIVRGIGSTIALSPPLVFSDDEIAETCDAIERALTRLRAAA